MNDKSAKRQRSLLKAVLPQLILLTLISLLYVLSLLGALPSPIELNRMLVDGFKEYGLPLIAICSFVENLVGVNAYFPGAFTILTGMSLTAGHPAKALVTYFAIYLPAYIANLISFFLARSYPSPGPAGQPTHSNRLPWVWFILTYWHPQLAALTAFAAGSHRQINARSFVQLSLSVSFGWSIFWGMLIYHFGLLAHVVDHFALLFFIYVIAWALWDAWKFYRAS